MSGVKRRDDVWKEACAASAVEIVETGERGAFAAGYFDGYLKAQEIGKAAMVEELRALACMYCHMCADGWELFEDSGNEYWHRQGGENYGCLVSTIHARIAAIGEGEG